MRLTNADIRLAATYRARYADYRALGMGPKSTCAKIGAEVRRTADEIGMMISYMRDLKVCPQCWTEYKQSQKKGNPTKRTCYPCELAERRKSNAVYRSTSRRPPPRYYEPDELRQFALKVLKMTEEEFAAERADTLVMPKSPSRHIVLAITILFLLAPYAIAQDSMSVSTRHDTTWYSATPICPACGDTANSPNLSLAVGNDDPYHGNVCWIPACKVFVCDDCGCLFVRERGKRYAVRRSVAGRKEIQRMRCL